MFNGKKWIKDVLLSKHPKNSLQEVNYGKKNMLGTVAVFLFLSLLYYYHNGFWTLGYPQSNDTKMTTALIF